MCHDSCEKTDHGRNTAVTVYYQREHVYCRPAAGAQTETLHGHTSCDDAPGRGRGAGLRSRLARLSARGANASMCDRTAPGHRAQRPQCATMPHRKYRPVYAITRVQTDRGHAGSSYGCSHRRARFPDPRHTIACIRPCARALHQIISWPTSPQCTRRTAQPRTARTAVRVVTQRPARSPPCPRRPAAPGSRWGLEMCASLKALKRHTLARDPRDARHPGV